MNRENQPGRRDWGSVTLCVLLSLLLHAALAWALDLLPRSGEGRQSRPPAERMQRHVQLRRAAPKPKEAKPQEKPATQPLQQEREAPFAKTSADERQRRPEQADFIGRHDSVAENAPDAPQRRSDAALPSMAGRVSEDEVVTFDQERQDGELAHEGKAESSAPPAPPVPASTESAQPPQPVAQGSPQGNPTQGRPEGEGAQLPQPAIAATAAREPVPPSPGEGLNLGELNTADALTLTPPQPPPARLGHSEGQEGSPAASASPAQPERVRVLPRDPSLADSAQPPGLRTHERRTRSTGRFVFGRRPALNVAATERGRYEADIYRRIARVWYAACDEHRGDIIPGSITVSLRLTKSGRIDSMALVRRRGASLIQQSFSFGAIRQASLPPMPQEVQQELIGQLYEMILTFNFD